MLLEQGLRPISRSGTIPELVKVSPQVYRSAGQFLERGLSEDLLAFAYLRYKREEILPLLFYERMLSISEFIAYFRGDRACALGCWSEEESGIAPQLEGVIWLSDAARLGGRMKLDASMGFFRGIGVRESLLYGQMACEWIFDILDPIVLTGATPEANRAAVIWSRRLGFETFGPVPKATLWNGEPCGVIISAMTRERWREDASPWRQEA